MKLRRLDADMQDFRDLLGRLAFAHELQDLPLAGCQLGTVCCRLRGARVHDCLGGTGADVEPATAYFLYSVYQVVGALTLLDKPPHPDLESLPHEAGVVDAGEQDHGTCGGDARDLARGVDAIEHRHGDVQNGDVGGESLHRIDRGAPIGEVGDDLQAAALQQGFQRLPQHQMVISQDQTNRHSRPPNRESAARALAQLGRRAAEGISSYRRSLTTRLTCGYDG